ncbi:YihY/virulence factor BrkB family protein [Flavisphingomonas formosensis]|uniref:YihY/virulence factor BrkB family protein n=1 Tax=Flavisphingomonas formosensis TaxID=861534 RepID=UPI0012F74FCD|nr:YihY/virulence factor BrkB family protein [Sphingomonas formosensis]
MTSLTAEAPPGRRATNPWKLPGAAWKQVAIRTFNEASQDNIGLVAAGVAFYAFLALVPLLGAIVLSYGLVADPQTVIRDMHALTDVMPADAAKLVGEQLMNVVQSSSGKKGFGLLIALAISFYGARNGASSIVTALNIAYEETERRSFLMLNLLALVITAAMVVVMMIALFAVAALGHLEALLPTMPDWVLTIGKIAAYAVMVLAGAAGAATLYRYGPDRARARWVWLTPGSLGAAVSWLLLTLGFGLYAANFGNYGATYGSLSAVIVLLTWLYFSSYVLLLGAELNSELEHQTEHDTTAGAERPLGQRGAWVADHVAGDSLSAEGRASPLSDAPEEVVKESPFPGNADPAPRSIAGDYVAGRLVNRVSRILGAKKVGAVPALLTTCALAMLRRRGREPVGMILLAAGGGLAWLSRDRTGDASKPAGR